LPHPHPIDAALTHAQRQRTLAIKPQDIIALQVFKRSFDARKAELLAVYIVDIALADAAHEAAVLARFAQSPAHPGHA
jgi:hypothetical protein